jgi:hypothetical protein
LRFVLLKQFEKLYAFLKQLRLFPAEAALRNYFMHWYRLR